MSRVSLVLLLSLCFYAAQAFKMSWLHFRACIFRCTFPLTLAASPIFYCFIADLQGSLNEGVQHRIRRGHIVEPGSRFSFLNPQCVFLCFASLFLLAGCYEPDRLYMPACTMWALYYCKKITVGMGTNLCTSSFANSPQRRCWSLLDQPAC
jgi:hypothetical protein